ncbi:cysteine--tRNA ligase [Roseinatronobacter bogoriensis]|uniref:Cysteine--tRNA ligase n=1 Tax=Roseinatronobacter bogoriensis subsp. barguzinensis TaxID=441209 RepID=A0A2K8KDX0_9RHOB|nr:MULTISPECIES: cysteine--tRNA ligase [Rhodobaca]ATX66123.1 cysteine--tRNA ligase [Rhodobaca barguzinensis]MBB4207154.1 cysteinyl-tRNA synthetase [Rhodobaca bogoriensis DSM 18756]TDW40476.1 cysteinyl-tRNA synthetase [Rhodobaca barguzinensis]TDY70372.1 cysteinyl-tRNA synthetase [Rhodobaca bogoriensis DSM 18756]
MTEIRLHNSRTRRKQPFAPLDAQDVRMYVCGPTVYDRAHLGNARPVVVFDVLYRLLRHVYGKKHVTYVRNFTDVDDKINARARMLQEGGDTRSLNEIIRALTDETIDWYHADMDALGALRPNHEPRATEFIVQMVAMIQGLIDKGHAYAAEGHVLFDVRSYPEYGKLSGRSVDDMIAGARVEVAPYKRDPMDFVLWKPSSVEEPGWDSPWGRGRPGWHIECSAMSHELLGPAFDIHGGGIDLQFPHHENEIAQSCCAHPDADFANFWLHNEMVQVEGKKMSKSLGNFFTVRDLLDELEKRMPKRVAGEVIRLVMIKSHYRQPMDWTEAAAKEAEATLRKWARATENVQSEKIDQRVIDALSDDLNVWGAITVLNELAANGDGSALLGSARFLGLLSEEVRAISQATEAYFDLQKLLILRAEARKEKNFARADLIRKRLDDFGIQLVDQSATVTAPKFEVFKIEEVIQSLPPEDKENLLGQEEYVVPRIFNNKAFSDRYQSFVARKVLGELE